MMIFLAVILALVATQIQGSLLYSAYDFIQPGIDIWSNKSDDGGASIFIKSRENGNFELRLTPINGLLHRRLHFTVDGKEIYDFETDTYYSGFSTNHDESFAVFYMSDNKYLGYIQLDRNNHYCIEPWYHHQYWKEPGQEAIVKDLGTLVIYKVIGTSRLEDRVLSQAPDEMRQSYIPFQDDGVAVLPIQVILHHTVEASPIYNQSYHNLLQYVFVVLAGTNGIFERTELRKGHNASLALTITDVEVHLSPSEHEYNLNETYDDIALLAKKLDKTNDHHYAFNVLFTFNTFVYRNDSTMGIARPASICSDYGSALVKLKESFGRSGLQDLLESIRTTTHEIGHILGAKHDHSIIGSDTECRKAKDPYVMNYRSKPTSKNYLDFSPCSRDDMYITMRNKGGCIQWAQKRKQNKEPAGQEKGDGYAERDNATTGNTASAKILSVATVGVMILFVV